MRLTDYINEEVDGKKRFNEYLKTNGMLRAGVALLRDITKKGYKAYIVGGSVRDIILGHNPHDVDITTNMPVDELEKSYKTYDIGKSKDFGIVVVKKDGHDFEVAAFRTDGTYTDGRRPDSIKVCTDFKADASRRDLCFNAMGIDGEGNIIDYFDGQKDIKNKIVRTVGNPNDRFQEDYLRMIRTARFAGKLGFEIESETKDAIKKNVHKLKDLSVERIKDELWKMASQSGSKFADTIKILDDVGILKIILPEMMKLKDFQEQERWHPEAFETGKGTPFDHTMAALRKNKIKDPLVNMALLLHDIGKGVTYKSIDGKSSFHGHAKEASEIIDTIAKRLKLSNKEKDAILFATVNHMKMHKGAEMKPAKIIKLVKDKNWELLKLVSLCDDSCRTGLFDKAKFNKTIETMEKISAKWGSKTTGTTVKVIDGKRVLKLTGLRPSKLVGDIIKKVTEIVLSKGIKSDKEMDKLIMDVYKEMK